LVKESAVEHSHNYLLRELFNKRFRHGKSFALILGERTTLGNQLYLCLREMIRDFVFACRQKQFRSIPYNAAYRVAIHAGLYRGIREGSQ